MGYSASALSEPTTPPHRYTHLSSTRGNQAPPATRTAPSSSHDPSTHLRPHPHPHLTQTHHHHRINPLPPKSRACSPAAETGPPPPHTVVAEQPGGGELTRIRALRIRLEDERAAACEPHRPDYLVRVQRVSEEEKGGESERNAGSSNLYNAPPPPPSAHVQTDAGRQDVPEPERVTPFKRRGVSGSHNTLVTKESTSNNRKRARLDEDMFSQVARDDPSPSSSSSSSSLQQQANSSGVGIVVSPARGRRLTLFQPKPRMQNATLDLHAIDARVVERITQKEEEPHTPPPPPPRAEDPTAIHSPPPYSLAIRSIDWHTPRSSRLRPTGLGGNEKNGQVQVHVETEEEERRRIIKERRMAAFRATKPSGRGERLRAVELVGRGRIVISCEDKNIVVGDIEPGTSKKFCGIAHC